MRETEIAQARVYGDAMLGLAESEGQADALLEELRELMKFFDAHPQWEQTFTGPQTDPTARKQSIEKIFRGRASDLLVNSLQVINRKGRLELIRAIVEAYRLAHEELRGVIDVHVTTAAPLTEPLRQRIRELAQSFSGKKPELVETVDDSLLGGVVVRIGDDKFDASVATKLRVLGEALAERASHEIHKTSTYVADLPV